jgi:hypothetical protein
MREEGDWKVRREEDVRNARGLDDHRRERERLVSLVRLSSELALPVKKSWLACVANPGHCIVQNLLALVLV